MKTQFVRISPPKKVPWNNGDLEQWYRIANRGCLPFGWKRRRKIVVLAIELPIIIDNLEFARKLREASCRN